MLDGVVEPTWKLKQRMNTNNQLCLCTWGDRAKDGEASDESCDDMWLRSSICAEWMCQTHAESYPGNWAAALVGGHREKARRGPKHFQNMYSTQTEPTRWLLIHSAFTSLFKPNPLGHPWTSYINCAVNMILCGTEKHNLRKTRACTWWRRGPIVFYPIFL